MFPMNADTWAEIRRLKMNDKLSITEIARQLRLDRKTVHRAADSDTLPVRRRPAPRPTKLDAYKNQIRERLKEFPRISCVRLLDELRSIGCTGGLTRLKSFVATIRPRPVEAFFRIETLAGEQAQVDWANCGVIRIGRANRKLSAFVMVLSYSRLMYVELTLSQCLEDFLQAHLRAFQFFGGRLPKKILYDNLKAVCLARLGTEIRFNPRFLEFSGHYLFEPVLCRPGRGNEKGKVESSIKYLRSSFLDGRPRDDFRRLQDALRRWLDEIANVRNHRMTRQRPVDRFLEEKDLLQPLPDRHLDLSIVRAAKATSRALVHFDGNLYSVHFFCASKMLTVRATNDEVRIFHKTRPVAKHARSFDRGVVIENPKHYAGLLETKKAARAAKATDRFLALAARSEQDRNNLEAYLKGIMQAEINIHRHLSQILEMADLYGRTELLQAVEQALGRELFGANYLKNIIQQNRTKRGEPEPTPLAIPDKPEWEEVTGSERDLSLYDDLFKDTDSDETT